MLNVLTGFGVVVLIIGLGYAIGRKQLLGPKALYPLNMYVFWIALPATLLRFMSHADSAPHGSTAVPRPWTGCG